MITATLLIIAGLLLVGVCVLAWKASRRRRIDQASSDSEGAVRERADNLRQISRDIDKENVSRARQGVLSVFGE